MVLGLILSLKRAGPKKEEDMGQVLLLNMKNPSTKIVKMWLGGILNPEEA